MRNLLSIFNLYKTLHNRSLPPQFISITSQSQPLTLLNLELNMKSICSSDLTELEPLPQREERKFTTIPQPYSSSKQAEFPSASQLGRKLTFPYRWSILNTPYGDQPTCQSPQVIQTYKKSIKKLSNTKDRNHPHTKQKWLPHTFSEKRQKKHDDLYATPPKPKTLSSKLKNLPPQNIKEEYRKHNSHRTLSFKGDIHQASLRFTSLFRAIEQDSQAQCKALNQKILHEQQMTFDEPIDDETNGQRGYMSGLFSQSIDQLPELGEHRSFKMQPSKIGRQYY